MMTLPQMLDLVRDVEECADAFAQARAEQDALNSLRAMSWH